VIVTDDPTRETRRGVEVRQNKFIEVFAWCDRRACVIQPICRVRPLKTTDIARTTPAQASYGGGPPPSVNDSRGAVSVRRNPPFSLVYKTLAARIGRAVRDVGKVCRRRSRPAYADAADELLEPFLAS
jgi:hypothetical protein